MTEQDRSTLAGEGGFGLIELLIAMVVMGIAFVGLLAGMATTTASATVHRTQAVAELELRRYAELVDAEPYSAGGVDSYRRVPEGDPTSGTAGIVGFTVLNSAVFPFEPIEPSCTVPSGANCTPTDRTQIVTIGVRTSDGRVDEKIQIVKRAS